MNILKIVKQDDKPPRLRSYITEDQTILCLSYPNINNGYNHYFDQLDLEEQTYQKVKKIELETDFIQKIPKNISKFVNLEELNVAGSRFWHLDMTRIPDTIKILRLVDHSNLSKQCINGMDRLINLEKIYLDFSAFSFDNIFEFSDYEQNLDEKNIIPIPDLNKLKLITFCTAMNYDLDDFKYDWQIIFTNNPLLKNIKYRITNIRTENNQGIDIIILLE